MKSNLLLLFALLLFACEPSNDQKRISTVPTVISSYSPEKRTELLDHLAENSPNWQIIPPQFWLPTAYINEYNGRQDSTAKISYDENTLAFGDFNGDQKEDAIAFLINRKAEVWLMAMFGKEEGYDLEPIFPQHEGIYQKCCLGIGLRTVSPGAYTDKKSGQEFQVKQQAIEYTVYDKISFLTFLDNGKFNTIQLTDLEN